MNSSSFLPFLQQEFTRRLILTKSISTSENSLPPEPSLPNNPPQRLPLKRRDLIPEQQGRRLKHPLSSVIKNADIRIHPNGQITLLLLQSHLRSGVHGRKPGDILESAVRLLARLRRRSQVLSATVFSPQDGKTHANRRNTAPSGKEAAVMRRRIRRGRGDVLRQQLEIRRAGRVIRDNGLDDAVIRVPRQLSPQGILVLLGADGRATFVAGVAGADLLGG